ncbi:MAG: cation:proton antiporter [Methanomassiliicoccales archaeon]
MVATQEIMFEVGIIMLVSFIGAALAAKAKQSVILGYIVAGVLIGPFIHFNLFGIQYDGLMKDTSFISYLSTLGLTLLMFFVGLEFSVTKLKKTKSSAFLLALVNTGLDFFIGILIGLALGWPIIDTVFLAGVIAMGSAAITGQSLMELQKMSSPETEFLLGMVVVEDFLSMILMTIAGGLLFKSGGSNALTLTTMIVGVLAFYTFFIFLALFVIPRCAKHFEKIKSDEMFVLFALGLVFLSSAMAEVSGVPAIIGAFFLGMVFAETKISDRLKDRISPFKDALVAVFFISFGMLIDPGMFPTVIWIVAIAVPMVILGDLFLTSALAYFLGFSGRSATFMGTSMCGRGAESVMFASVGSNAAGVTKASQLNPFAGTFCFAMSMLTPMMMRASDSIYGVLRRIVPSFAKYSSSIMNRTMNKMILPSSLKLFRRSRKIEVTLVAYFIALVGIMISGDELALPIFLVALATSVYIYYMLEKELRPIIKTISYDNLGVRTRDPKLISGFISMFICASLLTIASTAFVFRLGWYLCLIIFLAYFLGSLALMWRTHKLTTDPMTLSKIEQRKMERDGLQYRKADKKRSTGTMVRDINSIDVPLPRLDDDMNWDPPIKRDERHKVHPDEAQRRVDPDDSKWRRL